MDLWHHSRENTTLVLLGVDLTLHWLDPGDQPPWSHLGQGRARIGPITALRKLTSAARAHYDNPTIVWVEHFEPEAIHPCQPLLRLLDEANLLAACENEEIPALLCGHTHESRVYSIGGMLLSVCGTTTQYHAPLGNYLHVLEFQIEEELKLSVEAYRYTSHGRQQGGTFSFFHRY